MPPENENTTENSAEETPPASGENSDAPVPADLGGVDGLALTVARSIGDAKKSVSSDRAEALDAYALFRDMVENSTDLEVSDSARANMVNALSVAVRADAELVKLAGLAVEAFKAATRPAAKQPFAPRQVSPTSSGHDGVSRREFLGRCGALDLDTVETRPDDERSDS